MVKTTGSFSVGKYVTRWRDARVSDEIPSLGFCFSHHTPPPAKASIAINKPVIVFGFLEWQDATGTWRGDWPYQVNATLSIAGPTPKSTSRPVGTGKGECWDSFGTVSAGNYTFTLDFAGDTQFHDGIIMEALQVSEPLGALEVFLASLPVVAVLAVVGVQELNKRGVLGR